MAYKRASRLRNQRDLELYRLELEDRFGQIPSDDDESARFFELLRVKLLAQAVAVSEVSLDKGQLKLRVSPQTPLDPGKLMAWVRAQKEAQLQSRRFRAPAPAGHRRRPDLPGPASAGGLGEALM